MTDDRPNLVPDRPNLQLGRSPAEVLVLSVDIREAWIRGHVDEAAAQAAVDAVVDRERVTSVSHVHGHFGLGVNEAGESVRGRIYLDPPGTDPGLGGLPVTIATLRRVRLDE